MKMNISTSTWRDFVKETISRSALGAIQEGSDQNRSQAAKKVERFFLTDRPPTITSTTRMQKMRGEQRLMRREANCPPMLARMQSQPPFRWIRRRPIVLA